MLSTQFYHVTMQNLHIYFKRDLYYQQYIDNREIWQKGISIRQKLLWRHLVIKLVDWISQLYLMEIYGVFHEQNWKLETTIINLAIMYQKSIIYFVWLLKYTKYFICSTCNVYLIFLLILNKILHQVIFLRFTLCFILYITYSIA